VGEQNTVAFEDMVPTERVRSVYDIDLDKLKERGIRLILSDLDNTLAPWRGDGIPERLADWYKRVVERGFTLCIVSNGAEDRVQRFAGSLGIAAYGGAKKPKPEIFLRAMNQFDATAAQTAMVGDQLLTDIRGGNRCGLHTILVLPIHPREWWGTKINRGIEWLLLRTVLKPKWREGTEHHD
jgi:uncharacterized protein